MNEPIKSTDSADGSAFQPDAFVNRAAAWLFRYDCPDSLELGEYYLGLVAEPRRVWIKDHIGACPLCASDFAGLKSFMAQTDANEQPMARPGILDNIQWLIAELLQPPQTGLAFAVRGSDEAVRALRAYSAGDYEITLDVSVDSAHPDHRQVTGLILGALDTPITIGLAFPGEVEALSTVSLDDAGNFILTDVASGTYDLLIRSVDNSPSIRIPDLVIPL